MIRSIRSGASIRTRSARRRRSNRCSLLPARELPLDAEAVREFRRRFRLRFSGDVARLSVYRGVSEGLAPPGIEFYLPLFFEHTASLLDYLPAGPGVRHRSGTRGCAGGGLGGHHARATSSIGTTSSARCWRPRKSTFRSPNSSRGWRSTRACTWSASARHRTQPAGDRRSREPAAAEFPARCPRHRTARAACLSFSQAYQGRVLLAADSPGRREVISQMLSAHGRTPRQLADWPQFVGRRRARWPSWSRPKCGA